MRKIFCSSCGTEMPGDSVFCCECGQRLVKSTKKREVTPVEVVSAEYEPPRPKRRRKSQSSELDALFAEPTSARNATGGEARAGAGSGAVQNTRGVEIAKGLRGCCSMVFVPIVAIAAGILAGQHWGICAGILIGVASLFITANAISAFISKQTKSLTAVDCLLPTFISIVCGVLFAPIALFAANLFSFATCIFSGVILTVALFAYRSGRIESAGWLVMPFLTFAYEILPIDLPTDLDNFLGLGVSTVVDVVALSNGQKSFKKIEDAASKLLDG